MEGNATLCACTLNKRLLLLFSCIWCSIVALFAACKPIIGSQANSPQYHQATLQDHGSLAIQQFEA